MGRRFASLNPDEERALLALCDAGRLYAVEEWIRTGRSLAVSGKKATPLDIAMHRGFHSLVELCLRHETSQTAKNGALTRAVADRRADLAELAVSYGADVRSVPFADAIYSWNRAIVALSLARDADPVTDHPFAWAFVERIRLQDADTLVVELAITALKVLTQTWTTSDLK